MGRNFPEASHSSNLACKNSQLLQETFFKVFCTSSTTKDYVISDRLNQVYFANTIQSDNDSDKNDLIKIKIIKMIIEYF